MSAEKPRQRSLSEAVRECDWDTARHLAAIRVAETMERTEAAREVKSLSLSLSQLIDRCEAANVGPGEAETPLDRIVAEAGELRS